MKPTLTAVAMAVAGGLAGHASAQSSLTIDTHRIIENGIYELAATDTLNITSTGILDAAPALSGSAIALHGEVVNHGSVLAALGTEINGLSIGGITINFGQIAAASISVQGRLDVRGGGLVLAGAYPYPGVGMATHVNGGRAYAGTGVTVSDTGVVKNEGTWMLYADAAINGIFDNHNQFTSVNNTVTLPAGAAPYTQLLRIGHPFFNASVGSVTNRVAGWMRLGEHSLLVNEGDVNNFGRFFLEGGSFQTGRWGAVHNLAGGTFTIVGGTMTMESGAVRDFDNAGWFHVFSGTFDNQGLGAFVNQPLGAVNVGEFGVFRQAGTGFINKDGSSLLVSGRFEGGYVENQSGTIDIRSGGVMDVFSLFQENGRLLVNGELSGNVSLSAGVLSGSGIINGSVFVGGPAGPNQQPPTCHATGYACFRPGQSPGTFTINGVLTFGEGSVLELEVERDGQGFLLSDLVLAEQVVFEPGSAIEVTLGAGVGALAQELDLLRCAQGCSFAGGPAVRVFGGDGALQFRAGALVLSAVPEPGVWALLLPGIALLRRHAARESRRAG